MKKTSSISKDGSKLSKSRFGCYFRCSLVNFKNFRIFFGTYGLFMVCDKVEEVLFLRNISKTICNLRCESLNMIPTFQS